MPDHTLKAAAGAAFLTLLFFLLIAVQPLLPKEWIHPTDVSAAVSPTAPQPPDPWGSTPPQGNLTGTPLPVHPSSN